MNFTSEMLLSLLIALLGGGSLIGVLLKGRFDDRRQKKDQAHEKEQERDRHINMFIDQIQEERDYTNEQLAQRDEKINTQNERISNLHESFTQLQLDHMEVKKEKRTLEYLLEDKKQRLRKNEEALEALEEEHHKTLKENETLKIENARLDKENEQLKNQIASIERRLSVLEDDS